MAWLSMAMSRGSKGIEGSLRVLCDWLDWMGFVESGAKTRLDRFIGDYEPYATSHQTLGEDHDMQEEVANAARAVAAAVKKIREGRLHRPDEHLSAPRPK